MDKDQMNEVFQGVVNDKFDAVVGKMVEKDGKYVFEGVALNKWGQVMGSITYVTGLATLVYVGSRVGYTIGEKIANKIHQRKIMKEKAKAYDDCIELARKTHEELLEQYPFLKDKDGKHFKNEESE